MKYALDDFNLQGVLRTTPEIRLTWLAMLRHTIATLAVVFSHARGGRLGSGSAGLAWDTVAYWPVLFELPILMLVLAAVNRRPKGSSWARKAWAKGLWTMRVTALLQVLLNAWLLRQAVLADDWQIPACWLALSVLILGYTFASKYLPDYFADFPPPPEDAKP